MTDGHTHRAAPALWVFLGLADAEKIIAAPGTGC